MPQKTNLLLEPATENQRRHLFMEHANAAYAKLRSNKKAWRAWKRELRQLDPLSEGVLCGGTSQQECFAE